MKKRMRDRGIRFCVIEFRLLMVNLVLFHQVASL